MADGFDPDVEWGPRDERFYEYLRHQEIPDRLIAALAKAPLIDERAIDNYRARTRRPPTARQLQALNCLAHGLTIDTAALELGVHMETVRTLLRMVRAKLEATNTTHAVAIAIRQGLIV